MNSFSQLRSVVRGVGSYLPEKILTNAELAQRVETSDDWIVQRTGIQERHIAAPNEKLASAVISHIRAGDLFFRIDIRFHALD